MAHKRGASYCVTVSKKKLLFESPIGGSEKCHCKRGASYCVTETSVTVSGELCICLFGSIWWNADLKIHFYLQIIQSCVEILWGLVEDSDLLMSNDPDIYPNGSEFIWICEKLSRPDQGPDQSRWPQTHFYCPCHHRSIRSLPFCSSLVFPWFPLLSWSRSRERVMYKTWLVNCDPDWRHEKSDSISLTALQLRRQPD